MLASLALFTASTIADIEGTEACLKRGTCREVNPLMGSKPSRLRAYGTAMPLNAFVFWAAAAAKQHGKRVAPFLLLWSDSVAHAYFAANGFSLAAK